MRTFPGKIVKKSIERRFVMDVKLEPHSIQKEQVAKI
jgi:hypothetical protein